MTTRTTRRNLIYIIRADLTDNLSRYKVGVSKNPVKRLLNIYS